MRRLQRKIEIEVSDIKLVVFDVDGVLTDNRMIFLKGDQEAKSFSAADGFAIKATTGKVLNYAVITARASEVTERRCRELGVGDVIAAWDKITALTALAKQHGLKMNEICYVGNDIPDLVAMEQVGLAVCVADTEPELLEHSHYQTERLGGRGACREVINFVVKAKGLDLVQIYRDGLADAKAR